MELNTKVLSIVVEPANYTLELIRNIYEPRGVKYVFMYASSLAADQEIGDGRIVLSRLSFIERVRYFWDKLEKFDIFVLNGYTGNIPMLFIALNMLFFRKPFGIESDTELIIPKNSIKRFIKAIYLKFLFSRKYCFGLAGGNYGHKELFRHYGMAESHIFLAPMVVNNALYEKSVCLFNRERKDTFHFGYLGRLVKIKQVDKIIEAFRLIFCGNSNVELIVVGEGCERRRLEEAAEALPVRFEGALFGDAKIEMLHKIDCLVLYSSYEPWGLVVNEALASGVPVILSDKVGARRDLVEAVPSTGMVAKWDDITDLAEKMRTMMADVTFWSECKNNALCRMKEWSYSLYGKCFDRFLTAVAQNGAVL